MPATARITGSRSNRPDSGPSSDLTGHATADGETTQHGPFAFSAVRAGSPNAWTLLRHYYADAYSHALGLTGDASAITRDGKQARAAKRRA